MKASALVSLLIVAITGASCAVGVMHGIASQPQQQLSQKEFEKRTEAALRGCTINQVIQVQIPHCRKVAENVRKIADKNELTFAEKK